MNFGNSSEKSTGNTTSVETSNNLTSALTEKEEIIQDNQKQIKDLQDENKMLNEEKQNLESEKSRLEEENKTLNAQVEQLKKTSETKSTTSNATTSTQNTQTSTTKQNTNSAIVYVTNTGEKYHKSNCSYLKKSKIQINLSEAKAQGYTPCSRCY